MNIQTPTPPTFRKYIYEYVLAGLSCCVVYLFFLYNNLNIYIRETQGKTQNETNKALIENTAALHQINFFLNSKTNQNENNH